MGFSSRRGFFRQTLAWGTAAAVAGSLSPLPSRADECADPKIKLGLCTYLWGQDWDLPTLLANCQKTGILGLELRVQHKHGVEPSLNAQQRREIKKRFADGPVTFVGLGTNECYDSPDKTVVERAIENTKRYLQLSRDCGASGVKVKPNDFHKNVPREKTIEQIGQSLNRLGFVAADMNQQIRLEVHGTCAEPVVIKQIVDIAQHPSVTVCWNSNPQDLEGKGVVYNFNLLKDRLGATLHIHELGSGKYPFQILLDLLVEASYAGWALLECHGMPKDRLAALAQQRELFNTMLSRKS